jgi:hypothetical protein
MSTLLIRGGTVVNTRPARPTMCVDGRSPPWAGFEVPLPAPPWWTRRPVCDASGVTPHPHATAFMGTVGG